MIGGSPRTEWRLQWPECEPMVKTLLPLIVIAPLIPIQNGDVRLQTPLASIVIVKGEPDGCRLARSRSTTAGMTTIVSSPIPDNPWVGDDIGVISQILKVLDSPILVPDGPPDRRTVTSMWLERARRISEGAAAIYDSGAGLISLYALKYRDAGDLEPNTAARHETGATFDLRRGVVRVVMFGDRSKCADALARHVRSTLSGGSGR